MAAAKPQKTAKIAKSTKVAKVAKTAKTAKVAKTVKVAKTARAVALDDFLTLNIETRAILEALSQALTRLERAIDRAQQVGIATLNAPLQESMPHAALEDGERERDGTTDR
jgi:hypothetical protein